MICTNYIFHMWICARVYLLLALESYAMSTNFACNAGALNAVLCPKPNRFYLPSTVATNRKRFLHIYYRRTEPHSIWSIHIGAGPKHCWWTVYSFFCCCCCLVIQNPCRWRHVRENKSLCKRNKCPSKCKSVQPSTHLYFVWMARMAIVRAMAERI